MRVGLLVCGALPDDYRSVAGGFEEMFSSLLDECEVDLIPYAAFDGVLPADPAECDGYVISGSKSAAYDEDIWIRDLEAFIRASVDAAVPVFGVCFGLQVMAKALGGRVEKFQGGWGAGVHTMSLADPRPWMEEDETEIALIMSHEDQVVALPEAAAVLGSSDHCANFLVEFSPIHIGIQGHPEFGAPFAEHVYRSQPDELGPLAAEALASLDDPTDARIVASWMCRVLSGTRID